MNFSQIAVQLGVPGIILALIAAVSVRRLNQANYAKVINEISVGIATDLRKEAKELREENRKLDEKVDEVSAQLGRQAQQLEGQREQLDGQREQISALDGHVVELSTQLRIAIPLLEERGHDVDQMRAALRHAREL
ncbi:hypothetical protein JGU71_28135 [Antrihabitans sp. YC3-6]|uniref:Uncharacterized protein n=1 Tax=Antrihabitans stalagmiti TaxID=2799499 RepID=A0A934U6N6_9NOCA|nr:hypothetical protein [Antrihabitans stalagmiti]MBJ8342765.1 hypothetical protein [Antrihabitans stalagmiti]